MQVARQPGAGSEFCLDTRAKKVKLSVAVEVHLPGKVSTRRQIPARLRHRYRMEE
jgi:hypothetical protein